MDTDEVIASPSDRKLTRAEKLEVKSEELKRKNYNIKLRKLPWYRKKIEKERRKTARLNQLEAALERQGAIALPAAPGEQSMTIVAPPPPVYKPVEIPDDIADDQFIEKVATQPKFKEIVSGAEIEDPRVAKFLKMIGQVENRSFTWCARTCGLSNSDLARIWRDSNLAEAFFRVTSQMPALADKLIEDAMGAKKSCPRCDGIGYISIPPEMRSLKLYGGKDNVICPNCKGRRVVLGVGSIPDKQIVFEKIGWIRQQKGVSVNVNMNAHSVDATVSEMDGIEGEILEHRA